MVAGAVAMSASFMAHAQSYGYGGYGNHPMMSGGWFMGPIMMILMIAVLAVAVFLVLKFLGIGTGAKDQHGARDNALAILNERFAKGEIDKAEYEERKKSLVG